VVFLLQLNTPLRTIYFNKDSKYWYTVSTGFKSLFYRHRLCSTFYVSIQEWQTLMSLKARGEKYLKQGSCSTRSRGMLRVGLLV
jgi:hypothetical protein